MPENTTTPMHAGTPAAPLTAEDFSQEIVIEVREHGMEINWEKTDSKFEELLSQVRSQAFSEGRKAGLKEMDEAIRIETYNWRNFGSGRKHDESYKKLDSLRQEYAAQ